MNIPNTERVSSQVVAAVLGISGRHVTNLLRAGVLVQQVAKGKYDLVDSVHRYAKYIQQGGSASGELASARQQTEAGAARKLKLENDLREGELIPAADVYQLVTSAMSIVAQGLDSLGGRVAGRLATMSDSGLIRQLIFQECRAIRASAADALLEYSEVTHGGKSDGKSQLNRQRRSCHSLAGSPRSD